MEVPADNEINDDNDDGSTKKDEEKTYSQFVLVSISPHTPFSLYQFIKYIIHKSLINNRRVQLGVSIGKWAQIIIIYPFYTAVDALFATFRWSLN